MDKSLEFILGCIKEYEDTYRHPNLERFEISELYSLFPEGDDYGWPNRYHFDVKSGVYILLNKNKGIIYIGKARILGHRLQSYFGYDKNGKCGMKVNWKEDPMYIVCVSVPDSSPFESSSLEEFLINKIKPDSNSNLKGE